ncbi:MAG TPA: ribonuclease D [Longimicrobiales bacterium]
MEYVQSNERVAEVAEALRDADLVAADTEAAGYHRYRDRVCVLQLATRTATYVLDTLAVTDLSPLAELFADPAREVVFHDADYDLRLLSRDFGLEVRGLFDTKIAAEFLGERAIGLASVAEKYLGVHLEKKHQRADWAQRPLPDDLLEYAAADTRHLPMLRDRLRTELEARGRLAWAEEEFRIAEAQVWSAPPQDGDAYLRLKGTRDLNPRQLAALRELFQWRERTAEERDVAPFRVLTNEAMIELARQMPASKAALARLRGVPRSVSERFGEELLDALQRARALPEDELPVRPRGPRRPPPDPEFEALVERLRAARDAAADALGLDRGFLMPRSQLEELARRKPRTERALLGIPGVRHWQVEAAGKQLLEALSG